MLPTAQVVQPAAEKVEDGIRVVFSLSRDPDANVFNVRALLAPPKVPKQPETTGGPGTTRDDNLNTKAPISAVSDGNVPAGPPVGEPSAVGPDGDGNPAMEADVEDASHESEDDIGAQTDAPDSIPRPGRRRKRDEDDYYDYNDPFIDDSDLQDLVGPVIIQSKLKGYFMWRGQIETVQVAAEVPESPKKRGPYKKRKQPTIVEGGDQTGPKAGTSTDGAPKKKRKKAEATPAAGALSVHVEAEGIAKHAIGSASTPITPLRPALVGPVSTPKPLGDGEADSQRPLVTEDTPLHQSLLQPLADLQELAALGESWENKQKFPITLKPLLLDAARKAMDLSPDEGLEANFLHGLTQILPYNKITLRNLIQRHLLPERIQDKRTQLDASYTVARQKIAKQTIPITETKQETSSPMVSGAGHQQHKISWNKDLRAALYRIYELEFSIARLEDQLAVINRQESSFDENKVKAAAYDHLYALFPEGLIKRDALSRNFSLHKQQLAKKEEAATE